MARKRERVFALVMASAFLVTTVGVSASVIWQIMQENKTNKTSETQSTTSNETKDKLQGTTMENFTPVASVDKLETIDTKPGTGNEVKAGDTVTVDYTGAVAATGAIFQSSLDTGEPVSFGLDQVITGWKDGLVGMKEGGTRRLLIPADQAYGANPPSGSGIPANAALVFDVTLHKIGQ
ncbi:MAG TPA: FKBP-type peptidyl-prolyl cis-trans isomerase [Candidatus Saccharimonadales bacterium]|nr:FKBP-type peptidyl-prolyl cis-trans isomerase [Candidatus Saccharimonadales bacterium]